MSSYYNTENILNLPKIETINSTDYLIVQDANSNTQTSLLQFQNFIIGLENTTFQNDFENIQLSVINMNKKVELIKNQFNNFLSAIASTSYENLQSTISNYYIDFSNIN